MHDKNNDTLFYITGETSFKWLFLTVLPRAITQPKGYDGAIFLL